MNPSRTIAEISEQTMSHKPIELSERVKRIKPSPTLAVSARAEELQAQGKPIINLSVGEPDFNTPEFIKEAAIKAICEGHTKYTAVDGIKPLKQAVVDKFKRENNLHYELNQVIVSSGAKHSFYNLFCALLNEGDEVIIPAPYWVSYPDMAILNDGKPVFVETSFEQRFALQPEKLEAAITPRSRILVLNSPCNPTGVAYSANDLKSIAEVLLRHPQVLIASDDIYEHNIWTNTPFQNILNVCPELYDRCFVINGVSKTYAMTGWRIGYTAGPANIIAGMKKAQSQSTSNPTSIAQYAALAALNGDQHAAKEMTKAYKERHDFVISELQKIPGVKCIPSDGTFYTFPCIKELLNRKPDVTNDLQFAEYLLNEAEIAVVPGSAFGTEGFIRICFTTSMENLVIGMERMHKAINKLIS